MCARFAHVPQCYSGPTMQAKPQQTRTPQELVEDNRRFYDSLWSGSRLVEPNRFNTWPLVQSLLPPSGLRLEVAPGLRPRLPIEDTQFVDISAPALEQLRTLGGRVTLGEVTALPFATATFDLVCALDIIEHVDDDNGALSEISRVTKSGGMLLISTPLHPSRWTPFDDFVGHKRRSEPPCLQAKVAVITVFGKYHRVMREGLNIKWPWEKVAYRLSLQNRALQLEFQAITQDQANVKFATMVLYAVAAAEEEAIKKAVFSFASGREFQLALQRTIDGSIRQFVATTKQSDILGMRAEIVEHTKRNLDEVVLAWGYVVRDIQITDMTFDKEIIDSMARVVSSKNLLAAASNEGAALLVKRTKDAEAEAAYKTIGAEADKKAAALRGQGLALFRKNIADGMKEAAESLKSAGVNAEFLLFLEYTDALKYVADHSQGKVIFMDNGAAAAARVVQGIAGMGIDLPQE